MTHNLALTVCILTRDRPETLAQCLSSVTSQLRPGDLVYVADNGPEMSPLLIEDSPTIKVLRWDKNHGCPGGRNRLAEAASSEWLLFVDDDGTLWSGSLVEAARVASEVDQSTCVVGGAVAWPPRSAFSRRHDLLQSWGFSGGIALVRRRAFLELGGYPEDGLRQGEEEDLAMRAWRAGMKIALTGSFGIWHEPAGRDRIGVVIRGNMRSDILFCWKFFPWYLLPFVGLWKAARNFYSGFAHREVLATVRGLGDAVRAIGCGRVKREPVDFGLSLRRMSGQPQ
jgi:GT2 family glycosyltransferase